MGMVVRTNTMAMNANRQLGMNNTQVAKSLEKLSSGFKINRAADDASGLAISEKMKAQIKGLETASANSQDGISLIQTAEGGAQEIHDMLNRMVELATKSANGTIQDDVDREAIQREVDDLNSEITRISKSTNFNGINLLDGTLSGGGSSIVGASFSGSQVAKSQAATADSQAINVDMSSTIDVTKATKDYLSIDGQKVTLDWANDPDAKALAGALTADLQTITEAQGKSLATQIQDTINNAAKNQGVSGSIKVTYDDGTKKFTFRSNNKGVDSEFSFIGSEEKAAGDIKSSVMSNLLVDPTAKAGGTSINKATLTYNGDSLTGTDSFNMVINGTTVKVAGPVLTKGTTTMTAAATALKDVIDTAIGDYNTQLGLTPGTYDTKSGLTGLKSADFTVSVGDDGNFKISYEGDEDINFSFADVGDRTAAATLGIAGGGSSSGGNGGLTLQIGDTGDSFNKVTVSVDNLSALGIGTEGLDVSTQTASNSAIDKIKGAINQVSTNRANLGSLQNRLEHTINNLDTTAENMTAANSRIRDTDMAKEMMNYTKMNVLTQAAQAMLAQANQQPQSILQLLQ